MKMILFCLKCMKSVLLVFNKKTTAFCSLLQCMQALADVLARSARSSSLSVSVIILMGYHLLDFLEIFFY